jgi:hypothetical protein
MHFPKIPLPNNKVLTGHSADSSIDTTGMNLAQRLSSRLHWPLKIRERRPDDFTTRRRNSLPAQVTEQSSIRSSERINLDQASDPVDDAVVPARAPLQSKVDRVNDVINGAMRAWTLIDQSKANKIGEKASDYAAFLKKFYLTDIEFAFAKKHPDASFDESDALLVLAYRNLNRELNPIWRRGTDQEQAPFASLKAEIARALQHFPKFEGPVCRFADTLDGTHGAITSIADIQSLQAKGEMTLKGFTSTAKDRRFPEDPFFQEQQIRFDIVSRNGRAIGKGIGMPQADEVIFPEGTRLKFVKWEFRDGSTAQDERPKFTIHMREV